MLLQFLLPGVDVGEVITAPAHPGGVPCVTELASSLKSALQCLSMAKQLSRSPSALQEHGYLKQLDSVGVFCTF